MAETRNTTTIIGSGEAITIHFSNEAPSLNVAYSPPSEGVGQPVDKVKLQEELGRAAALLSQREQKIAELQGHIASIEAETHHASLSNGHVGEVVIRSVLTTDRTLSTAHQRYERTILYFLQQPGFTVNRPNAGGFIREKLGIEAVSDWNNMRVALVKLGILSVEKASPASRKSNAISLSADGLISSAGKPFITPQVLEALKYSTNIEDEQRPEMEAKIARLEGQGGPSNPSLKV
ncbi:MAG TPA: hypothetical protein VH234_00965 [Candidatus Saccharimonadales bacterium]|jgi:hypothetical protein|nr:hypothetical protein [Candidatus Saccharimonadales bacterium]